jgi:hypothetical protein
MSLANAGGVGKGAGGRGRLIQEADGRSRKQFMSVSIVLKELKTANEELLR